MTGILIMGPYKPLRTWVDDFPSPMEMSWELIDPISPCKVAFPCLLFEKANHQQSPDAFHPTGRLENLAGFFFIPPPGSFVARFWKLQMMTIATILRTPKLLILLSLFHHSVRFTLRSRAFTNGEASSNLQCFVHKLSSKQTLG